MPEKKGGKFQNFVKKWLERKKMSMYLKNFSLRMSFYRYGL